MAPDKKTFPCSLQTHFPPVSKPEQALEDYLARRPREMVDDLARVDGDLLILGVGGKMGPTLARLARNALPSRAPCDRGGALFRGQHGARLLERHDIETIACDLLDATAIARLPPCANVLFMAGRKFGGEGDNPLTWAMNVHVPALVAQGLSDVAHRRVFHRVRVPIRAGHGPGRRRRFAAGATR